MANVDGKEKAAEVVPADISPTDMVKSLVAKHNRARFEEGETRYPPLFPEPLKNLIILFFELLQSNDERKGERLANEVFTLNGRYIDSKSTCEGREELLLIGKRTEENNTKPPKFELHLSRVYTSDFSYGDIVISGQQKTFIYDDTPVVTDWQWRILFDNPKADEPRIALSRVWLDNTAAVRMLEELLKELGTMTKSIIELNKKAREEQISCCNMM